MGTVAKNQRICMKCPNVGWRHGQGSRGVVPCIVDGVDIIEHYTRGSCPQGYHGTDPPPYVPLRTPEDRRKIEGPKRWAELHRRAKEWVVGRDEEAELGFILTLADGLGCHCRSGWLRILKEDKPDFSSAQVYSEKSERWHDAVNVNLGKPPFKSLTS